MTLVEVLVAMAILMAVAIPFLSIFLSSARNNADSQETLQAAALAQRAMTEIRARSAAELAADPGGLFYQDTTFTAAYSIESVLTSPDSISGQFVVPGAYALTCTLNPSSVQVGANGVYGLGDGFYYLEISGPDSPYTYSFYRGDKETLLASGSLTDSGGNVNIAIKSGTGRTQFDPQFIMHIKIDSSVSDATNFNFYISDQGDAVQLYNVGMKTFYQYYNLSGTPDSSQRNLYKITVEVQHSARQEIITRLVSYELK